MPLRIELTDNSGNVLGVTGEVVDEVDAALPDLEWEEFPLLAGVDRYDDTCFNPVQMGRLSIELQRLLENDPPRRLKKLIEEIQDLCFRGSRMPHARLRFIGD